MPNAFGFPPPASNAELFNFLPVLRLVKLQDEITLPCKMRIINDYNAEVILHEGKYHQVKRMFAYFGYTVVDLHRSEFAFLNLEGLEEADYRPLTNEEIEMLKECANKNSEKL